MDNKKSSANLVYIVICILKNGNVIPAFADSFSSALVISDMFNSGDGVVEIKILKISTGSTFEFIF